MSEGEMASSFYVIKEVYLNFEKLGFFILVIFINDFKEKIWLVVLYEIIVGNCLNNKRQYRN